MSKPDFTSDMIRLLRPHQWVKNVFVFLPAIFNGSLLNPAVLTSACEAFILFSLLASTIYIINDIADQKADRAHPEKCKRPIASGRIPVFTGYIIALVLTLLVAGGCALFFPAQPMAWLILGIYLLLNLAYSAGLKHIAILDAFIVAAGFILRVILGGVVCRIWVSSWLVVMVMLLALLIVFGKRRDDVIKMDEGKTPRRSVAGYNLTYINQVLSILSAVTIVAYICYTMQPDVIMRFGTQYIYLTSVFVIAALLRYLQLAIVREDSGSPSRLIYRDSFILVCVAAWLLTFFIIIYL